MNSAEGCFMNHNPYFYITFNVLLIFYLGVIYLLAVTERLR